MKVICACSALAVVLLSSLPCRAISEPTQSLSFERLVRLPGERTIALKCAGYGPLTVLLEPGDGGRRSHMDALFATLAKHYRVCSYDRRNIGESSAAPTPRTAATLVTDAFDALFAAGETGPFIGFGTSMGGLLVRAYAASGRLVGYDTSNQPGTAREWQRFAYPVMTPSQRADDAAWMAGDNNEHIDAEDVSRIVNGRHAAAVPHVILISTERLQCETAGLCGPVYRAFVRASRQAARGGRLQVLDGAHDLYATNLSDVVAAIDDVARAAATRRTK